MIKMRVQKLIDEDKSEAEAIAAKPTKDLDARWAPRGGFLCRNGGSYTLHRRSCT